MRWALAVALGAGKVRDGDRYIVVPAVNRRIVLVVIAWHLSDEGDAWPLRSTLQRETTLTPATLTRALRSLVADGLLVRIPRGGRSSVYRLGRRDLITGGHQV